MTDTHASSTGAGLDDPVRSLLGGLRDMWGLGAAALDAFTSQISAGPARTAPGANAFSAAVEPMMACATRFGAMVVDLAGPATGDSVPPADAMDRSDSAAALAPFVGQAMLIAAASALSYGRNLAEIGMRHQPSLMQALMQQPRGAASDGADARRLADALRGFLREVGEVATQEARHLEAELDRIAEGVARTVPPGEPASAYQRRWRAKP